MSTRTRRCRPVTLQPIQHSEGVISKGNRKGNLPCETESINAACVSPVHALSQRGDRLSVLWWQVLSASLEAHVAASDNSALAKDCNRDIKAANTALLKLSRKVHMVTSLSSTPVVGVNGANPICHPVIGAAQA